MEENTHNQYKKIITKEVKYDHTASFSSSAMTCLYWWHMLWFPSQRSLVVAMNQAVSLSINKFMSRTWDSCKTQ